MSFEKFSAQLFQVRWLQSTYMFIIQIFFHLTYSFPYCIFPHLKVSSSLEYHKLVSLIELHNQRRPAHKLTNLLSFRLNVEYKITLVLPYLSLWSRELEPTSQPIIWVTIPTLPFYRALSSVLVFTLRCHRQIMKLTFIL